MLSDRTIKKLLKDGRLKVHGPDEKEIWPWQIQPVSIDLRLGQVSLKNGTPLPTDRPFIEPGAGWWIEPNQFLLGSTFEWIEVSENLVGLIVGKSTIAREGLMVEAAGLVDPGFGGEITLELKNLSDERIRLDWQQPICQMTLDWTDTTPERIYNMLDNHYQGQTGPTPSWRTRL